MALQVVLTKACARPAPPPLQFPAEDRFMEAVFRIIDKTIASAISLRMYAYESAVVLRGKEG